MWVVEQRTVQRELENNGEGCHDGIKDDNRYTRFKSASDERSVILQFAQGPGNVLAIARMV